MTKRFVCKCINEFQDKVYVKNIRIHNQTKKQDGTVYRCAVCGNENKGGKIEKEK